ncbi:hypothetical protein Tco_0203301, partial [Tanacetum coccineum]
IFIKDKSSKKAQRQEAEVPQDEAGHEKSVPTPYNDPQPSGEDSMQLTELMVLFTKLQTQVLDLQKAKDAQAKEIATLKKRIQKLERRKISRPAGLKTNLFWEFRKFTSRDGESMESYYSRFYKLMNELTRNNLQVTTMQVNVQFL